MIEKQTTLETLKSDDLILNKHTCIYLYIQVAMHQSTVIESFKLIKKFFVHFFCFSIENEKNILLF